MESGVSGLAPPREWDFTGIVEIPELAGAPTSEFQLTIYRERTEAANTEPPEVGDRLEAELDRVLRRPYRVRLVRRSRTEWAVAAREVDLEIVTLAGLRATSLEVAVSPEGERWLLIDGEEAPAELDLPTAEALSELERRGRERFQAFAARADRVGEESWEVTIDPL